MRYIVAIGALAACVFYASILPVSAQVCYPDERQPGKVLHASSVKSGSFKLENNIVAIQFSIKNNKIQQALFTDKVAHQSLTLNAAHLFNLQLKDSSWLNADDFKIIDTRHKFHALTSDPNSLRGIDRLPGKGIQFKLSNKTKGILITWDVSLHDSSNFVEQHFHFLQKGTTDSIVNLRLVSIPLKDKPVTSGRVDGLPLLVNNMFLAIEHPMTYTVKTTESLTGNIGASVSLRKNDGFAVNVVWGVTPRNQLRRGYLYYLEKVRAVPYRPFLHYNSWYDLSWVDRHLHEKDCMDRIKMYIDSLIVKRRVHLKAFLWDDGWDDTKTLWKFNKDMPNGFAKMNELANPYGASMGVWISPWGGYGSTQQQRIESSKNHVPPLGTNAHGFSLADKNYFNFFKNTAAYFIKEQDVAIFKFDGVGAGNGAAGATAAFQKDIEGLLRAITELRKVKPDIYFSLTVGTWPSPYWLKFGDNIWRSGADFGKTGEGTEREKWLNYRDEQVYKNVVLRSKLYPLNALMNHGIDVAKNGYVKSLPNDYKSLSEDIWSFFGDGASLQELYVDPHLLTSAEWDLLAKAIHWSHQHKGILVDTHWVGGDPKDEVYGYAAWNPAGGTLMLRNPTNEQKVFNFTLEKALELPRGFNGKYSLYNVITNSNEGSFISTNNISLILQPQEVKVMNVNKITN